MNRVFLALALLFSIGVVGCTSCTSQSDYQGSGACANITSPDSTYFVDWNFEVYTVLVDTTGGAVTAQPYVNTMAITNYNDPSIVHIGSTFSNQVTNAAGVMDTANSSLGYGMDLPATYDFYEYDGHCANYNKVAEQLMDHDQTITIPCYPNGQTGALGSNGPAHTIAGYNFTPGGMSPDDMNYDTPLIIYAVAGTFTGAEVVQIFKPNGNVSSNPSVIAVASDGSWIQLSSSVYTPIFGPQIYGAYTGFISRQDSSGSWISLGSFSFSALRY